MRHPRTPVHTTHPQDVRILGKTINTKICNRICKFGDEIFHTKKKYLKRNLVARQSQDNANSRKPTGHIEVKNTFKKLLQNCIKNQVTTTNRSAL